MVFDGICNFCNGVVDFIIRRDPEGRFAFAPMQSVAGKRLIDRYYGGMGELDAVGGPDTLLLIRDGACLERTDAVLAIAGGLRWPWPLLRAFRILPRPFRDWFYRRFANNRYRLFGRRDGCRVPEPGIRGRFLE